MAKKAQIDTSFSFGANVRRAHGKRVKGASRARKPTGSAGGNAWTAYVGAKRR
jgi:hypothetical protein